MGFFSGTRKSNPAKFVGNLLFAGEKVECTYKLIRNHISLTDKRIIIVEKTFLARKVSIRSIPYHKIDNILLEKNRKLFSISNFLRIISEGKDYRFKIAKGEKIMDFYKTITRLMCEKGFS